MSLKKKIILSFITSVIIISFLAIFEYSNFIAIRKEIRQLEITDIIRSKSLQLRRHEKNYFLNYLKSEEESQAVRKYIGELNGIISSEFFNERVLVSDLKTRITQYERSFTMIESSARNLTRELETIRKAHRNLGKLLPLIEAIIIEHPLQGGELLQREFSLPADHRLISGLRSFDLLINALRKNGEDIIVISKELDKQAREHIEKTIQLSQLAIFIFFPLFFITGIGTIIFFNRDVVKRLKILIGVVERTGRGSFSKVTLAPGKWSSSDEVWTLIQKFNEMEEQLAQREKELDRKNKELFQSKKLAAIGTLASGVAHELNNPLNNIYISTQVLVREVGRSCPPDIKEVITDIFSQTLRVKSIVSDLLEFARGREPELQEIILYDLIEEAYRFTGNIMDTEKIRFTLDAEPGLRVSVDSAQMERVFINLFTNAIEAMTGSGDLTVVTSKRDDSVVIEVSDTGKGISGDAVEKIFEPFYTTKDKGTGLGLAIVFSIIHKHGGEVSIQSGEGKGTTFTIIIPDRRKGTEQT